MIKWRRPKQQSIGDGKHRRVRTNAERECQGRNSGEAGVSGEHAASVAQIARQICQPGHAALVAQRLHGLRNAPGPDPGCSCSALGRIGPLSRVLCGQLQVQSQFLLQVAVSRARTQRAPKAVDPLAEGSHRTSLSRHP